MKKKLCIITGSRAEWGLFYPMAKEIKKKGGMLALQIIAHAAHLSKDFGLTYKEIEADGFKIDCKVKTLICEHGKPNISESVAADIVGITKALKSLSPYLVFVLGDRFETFSAASAAFFLKIPIAHIHGGESTEGSMDDSLRHAITKLSMLHFTSTDSYRRRVIQMGEDPGRVYNVGALGVDNIKRARLLGKNELEKRTRFKFGPKNIMVTFNPLTMEDRAVSQRGFAHLIRAMDKLSDTKIIFTKPNPDMYSEEIAESIDDYVAKNREKSISFTSMGRELYLSTLKIIDVVAGNSSSGIIEAPSFGIPTINIGSRQKGRIKGPTIIDVEDDGYEPIAKAFKKAFSGHFRMRCKRAYSPYGSGGASRKIINIAEKANLSSLKKRFVDINRKRGGY